MNITKHMARHRLLMQRSLKGRTTAYQVSNVLSRTSRTRRTTSSTNFSCVRQNSSPLNLSLNPSKDRLSSSNTRFVKPTIALPSSTKSSSTLGNNRYTFPRNHSLQQKMSRVYSPLLNRNMNFVFLSSDDILLPSNASEMKQKLTGAVN